MDEISLYIASLEAPDPSIAEPASRALRRIAECDSKPLSAHRKDLLKLAVRSTDLRVRWNLMLLLGKLPLTGKHRAAAVDWPFERMSDASPFTRTFALQALFDLSAADPPLRARMVPIARQFAEFGTAAMRARARKLLRT